MAPVTGIVEEFSRRLVVGWVSVPPSSPPTRVDLFVNDLKLSSTMATPRSSMTGSPGAVTSADGSGPTDDTEAVATPVPGLPRPPDDGRNSTEEIRTFAFRVRGLWPYVKKRTRISVRVDGRRLPVHGHGTYVNPPRSGRHTVKELRTMLEQGYVLTQFGTIELSKQLDVQWQSDVIHLYDRTSKILRDRFGYDAFLIYGTLLGVVREGGYIGHDVDFDAAYISRHQDGLDATQELVDIALALIDAGLEVSAHSAALHIHDPENPANRIDLFHLYFDESGKLGFPFGVAGSTTITKDEWQGLEQVEFTGGRGLVPVRAEEFVEHLYGSDWRQPKPGFNWKLDRTQAAEEGKLTDADRTKVYWANFYSRTGFDAGSTFFEFVQARDDTPRTIVDIGCGEGRDARAFAASGRTVLALDQSVVGIEHASSRAADAPTSGSVRFRVCDVADTDDLGHALDEVDREDGGILFYLRFFLHAIPESVQDGLLDAIGSHAVRGDLLAAEFRTDKDEAGAKVHTKHYRRFQKADDLVRDLESRGWEIVHFQEDTGLSPYQSEDPVLCRVVARRV